MGVLEAEFDLLKMRQHLLTCLENLQILPFPKTRRKLKLSKKNTKTLGMDYTIYVDCAASCGLPNTFDNMVQRDANDCSNWYHLKCFDMSQASESINW